MGNPGSAKKPSASPTKAKARAGGDARSRSQSSKKTAPGRPFEKGKSGNPGGRPKIPAEVKEACKALTSEAVETLRKVLKGGKGIPAAAQVRAAEVILDRAWGKATQPISGEDGKPIDVAVIKRVVVVSAGR